MGFFYPTTSQLDSSVNRMNKLGCDHFIALLSNNDMNGFASNSFLQCQSNIQNVDLVAQYSLRSLANIQCTKQSY